MATSLILHITTRIDTVLQSFYICLTDWGMKHAISPPVETALCGPGYGSLSTMRVISRTALCSRSPWRSAYQTTHQ